MTSKFTNLPWPAPTRDTPRPCPATPPAPDEPETTAGEPTPAGPDTAPPSGASG
ncbi:hypothetical protein AB0393_28305 [Streptomyces cyaneofuscatus]|uniref:hypothetical protein n=1 Tax=Streptomyces cyaneofuscatus TaxID=66883 RepID=UPI00344F92FD